MQRLLLLSCLVLAASCFAQPQIIYYKFDDGSGAAARNHAVPGKGWSQGAFSAAPLWNTTTPQIPPAAVNNSGQNRRLNTGYSLAERNGQALTIELWFRTTGNGYQDFVNDSVNFGLWLFNGRIQLQVGGTTLQSSNTNNNDGTWRYAAVTRNAGNAWTLYWGTTTGGLSSVTGNIAHTFSTNAMGLLYWQGGSPATYNGEMDEFRLWSVQRSAAELQSNRFAPFLTQDIDVTDPAGIFVKHQGQAGFTNVASGVATDYTFTVRNGRPAGNVNFSGVSLAGITGATANVLLQPGTIAPGATTTFTIQVTPTAAAFSFTVNINNDRSPNPYTFTFTGMVNTGRPEMLYYRFNEGIGTTTRNDASPGAGNNPATFTAVSWTTTPNARLGASAVQNTSNLTTGFSCTQLPRPEFTLEFWVFKPNGNSTNTICGDGTSFRVYRQNATLRIQSGPAGGDQDISTGVSLTNNGWTHIAIVSNPGVFGLRVYRNGVQAFESVNYTFPFANAPLTVMSNAGANNLTGRLDEFRFWAHARSAANILADHTRELLGRLQVERPAATILATGGADALGGVPTGAPLTLTYTLRNIGSTGLLLGTPAVAFSGATNCSVNVTGNPSGTLLAASTATPAQVQVTPLAAAAFSFQLTFASNDPDVPNYVVNVSGTGVPGEIQVERPLSTIIADNGADAAGTPVAGLPLVLTYNVRNVAAAGSINLGAFTVNGLVNCGVVLTPPGVTTLAPGASTTMQATVTPTVAGAFSFALHLVNDDLNENPYDINVSGTALAPPEINVQRPAGTNIADGGSTVVAGTVAGVSTPVTFTIQNLGGSTLTLTGRSAANLVNCGVVLGAFGSATVAAGGSTTLTVDVTPIAAGAWSFNLDIDSDDSNENPYDIAVSGTGAPGGEINVQRPAGTNIADGGTDPVAGTVAGAPTLVTYTIQNLGTATLTLTGRSIATLVNCGVALGSFSSGSVAPGGSATLTVTVTPIAAGGWSFNLDINSDDSNESPYDIAVSGTAVPGGEINVERPSGTTIPDAGNDSVTGTVAGAPTVITYTIRNQGTATLTLTGRSFVNNSNCNVGLGTFSSGTVAPAGTATLDVTITPVAAAAWSFDLDITSNDVDEATYDIAVSGTAAPGGEINVERPALTTILDGGSDTVNGTVAGAPTVITYTIRNQGTATLTLTGRSFANNSNCNVGLGTFSSGTVAPAGTATVDVTITPIAAGGWSFDLDITSDDVDEGNYDIAVSGNAAPGGEINVERPALTTIADGGSDAVTGTVAGAPSVITYTIRNQGTATLNLAGRSFVNNINCSVVLGSFSSASLAPAATTTLGVTVTPIASGGWSFDLDIISDDVDEANYDIAVSGTAAPGGEIDMQRPAANSIADGGNDVVTGSVAGAPIVVTYTVANTGTAILTLSGQSAGSTANCGVGVGSPSANPIGAGGSATISVTITPIAAGSWSFVLQVVSDDVDEGTYDINVSGTAIPGGEINVERPSGTTILDGGSDSVAGTLAGAPTLVTYTIRNQGTATLTLTGRSFANNVNCGVSLGAFSSGTVAAGGTATLDLTITPLAAGGWAFDLDIDSDDLDESTYDIAVSGNAAPGGEINVERPALTTILDGGSDPVAGTVAGAPTLVTYTIRNQGTATLTLSGQGFTAAGNCGVSVGAPGSASLGPSATTALGVTITPVAAGGWSFTLQVFSDDLDEAVYDILVSGVAAPGGEIELQRPVGVAIADGGTDSIAGTVATFGTLATYTIRNFGTAALTIAGQGFAGAGNCGVVVGAPSSSVLAPGGLATLDVTVTPVAPGGWNFTLQVLSDDLDESSYDILVSGTAASNSSVTGVSVSPDNGGPLTVTAMVNGPAATSIDVVVSYSGGANAGPPVLISTSAGTISGNVILGVPANTALTLRWDAYASERHATDFAYILTLSPFIGVQPGTPGSSAPFALQRDGGWAKHETPTQICGPVFGHVAVFDTANDRMVIFGGKRNGLRTRETWVFERDPAWGPGWRKLSPGGTNPPELQYASAIYDAANGRMVVFGGQSNTGNRNQTWQLDLTRGAETWSQIAVASPATPSIRFGAAMVYDAAGQRALMHGGQDASLLADVWSLSLNAGTESWGTGALATLGTPPSARMGHAAALDAAGNRMVIYGGNTGTGTVADMHELALGGTPSWSLLSASVAAGARYFSTWTHDTANNALVVQSGFNGGSYLGNSWIMPLQGPSQHVWTTLPNDPFAGNGRVVGGAAFDPVRQHALFFGGLPSTGVPLTAFSVLDLSGAPGWQADQASAAPETAPAARWGASMVFDSTHNRVVLFGGKDNAGMFNDVWVLSRATATAPWVKFSTTGSAPVKRVYHAAVYDATGQRLIVFGGHDSAGVKLADLWALDLSGASAGAWTPLSAGGGPVARISAAMVHDTVQDRLVLFGGLGATYLNDTWVWNLAGSGWVQLAPTGTLPTPRYSSRAMFDASLNRMVVVAGLGSGGFTSQVFALDLTLGLEAWANISAPVAPVMPARSDFAMGFAANGRRAWIFGGYNGGQFADVWELDVNGPTAVWAQLTVSGTGPLARHALPGCLDGAGRLVIGLGYTNGPVADLWALDPANLAAGWTRPVVEISPSKLVTSVVALDAPRNRLVAFGGLAAGQPVAGLWQLDLSTPVAAWQPLAASGTGPSGRRTSTMVYDAVNDRMVIFGGRTGVAAGTIVGEVWALNLAGTPSWTLLTTSGTAPGPRAQHVAVVDGANRMIVWGGSDNLGVLHNSAFALDLGSLAWANLAPTGVAPLARIAASAAYDAQGNRVIIYGGSNNGATGILNVLDLSGSPAWTTQAVTGTLPPALFYHSMVYDNATRRILLFGGFSTAAENGLYVLDLAGASWTRVTPPVATPQARWAHGAVWHPGDNRLCIVGGYVDGEIPAVDATGSSDVWFWGD